jgi:hypothetical protein
VHGQIIRCEYWVEVRLKGRLCVSDLKMKAPIVIHPPQPEGLPFFAKPPPEWTPTKVTLLVPVVSRVFHMTCSRGLGCMYVGAGAQVRVQNCCVAGFA